VKLSETAMQAVVVKALGDLISDRLKTLKLQAEASFTATETNRAAARLPDGTKVATVSMAGGEGHSAYVASEELLMAWVLANHPGEVEMVIRPSYVKKLTDAAKKAGRAIDPATGEVVPGIEVGESKPYVSIRFETSGREAIAEAWRNGDLQGVNLVAPAELLPGPAEDSADQGEPRAA